MRVLNDIAPSWDGREPVRLFELKYNAASIAVMSPSSLGIEPVRSLDERPKFDVKVEKLAPSSLGIEPVRELEARSKLWTLRAANSEGM